MQCENCDEQLQDGAISCPVCGMAIKGVSIVEPNRIVETPEAIPDDHLDRSVTTSSRSAVASEALNRALVTNSRDEVSVALTNLAALKIKVVPPRVFDNSSSFSSTTAIGCNIFPWKPLATAGNPRDDLQTLAAVSVPIEDRFCQNSDCEGDPDSAVDENRTRQKANKKVYHVPPKLEDDHCFCLWCGAEHWFAPNVEIGELIAGRYRVVGWIARGGFGVVVLLFDELGQRYVAGKVIANANDPNAVQAAVQERFWLTQLVDAKIVSVFDFPVHKGNQWIIEQYIGGKTLKQIIVERLQQGLGPLPVKIALAVFQSVLSVFTYFRSQKVVYRDFNLKNIKQFDDSVILLDLGALTHIDNQQTTICTLGYAPPEAVIADTNTRLNCFGQPPGFDYVSDLWTVIRSLVISTCTFEWRQKEFLFNVPPPSQVKAFRLYPSFHALVKRGLRFNKAERFQSPEELSDAMRMVMRDVTCADFNREIGAISPHHIDSIYFAEDTYSGQESYGWRSLPKLKPIPGDKGNSILIGLNLAPKEEIAVLLEKISPSHTDQSSDQTTPTKNPYEKSLAFRLRIAELNIELGQYQAADAMLNEMTKLDPFQFRITWMRMLSALSQVCIAEARSCAEAVHLELPGHSEPKVALAYCAELGKDYETATALANLVTITDDHCPSAAFMLARVTLAAKEGTNPLEARTVACEALSRIPRSSGAYSYAMLEQARVLTRIQPGQAEFEEAVRILGTLRIEGFEYHRVRADVLLAAARALESGKLSVPLDSQLLGKPFSATELRLAVYEELRQAAFAVVHNDKRLAYNLMVEALSKRPETEY